jgi:hypothetical protein
MNNKWREHPKLKGRFHPDYPDDLQVIVHDGGPRFSSTQLEVVWVAVTGMMSSKAFQARVLTPTTSAKDTSSYDQEFQVFKGRVLNQPHKLQSIHQGSNIKFITAHGTEFIAGLLNLVVTVASPICSMPPPICSG